MQVTWTKLIPLDQAGVSKINELSGVYCISHHEQNKDSYIIHYVGQAENLNERLSQHLSGNETNPCCNKFLKNHSCYFRACAVSTQGDRDGAESVTL